jgi:hypothetical protein
MQYQTCCEHWKPTSRVCPGATRGLKGVSYDPKFASGRLQYYKPQQNSRRTYTYHSSITFLVSSLLPASSDRDIGCCIYLLLRSSLSPSEQGNPFYMQRLHFVGQTRPMGVHYSGIQPWSFLSLKQRLTFCLSNRHLSHFKRFNLRFFV